MIVRTLDETKDSEREVSAEGWISRRLLLAPEGMGFSMHDTTILAGAELPMCYPKSSRSRVLRGGFGKHREQGDRRAL